MKRKILFYAFFILNVSFIRSNVYCQGISIISNNIISQESNDWDKYNSVRITTSYTQQKVGKLQFRIYTLEDSLFLQSETVRLNDTIEVGEELNVGDIAEYNRIALYGSFEHYFNQFLTYKPGNYRLVVTFHDTLYEQLLDSVSTFVTIDEGMPGSNIFPYCYFQIYSNFMDSITFQWSKPKPKGGCVYSYGFNIIELDSNIMLHLDTIEHLLKNNTNSVFNVTNMLDTFINISTLSPLIQDDKFYAWAVRVFCSTDSLRPLKYNDGYTVPFVFIGSDDTTKKLYKKGDGCDDLTNGFEDGNLDGWIGQSGFYRVLSKKENRSKPTPHVDLEFTKTGLFPKGHNIIQAPFTDAHGGFPVPDVGFGSFAMKLGNSVDFTQITATAHRIRRTFTVTQKNKILKMRVANVMDLQDGPEDLPIFSTIVYKGIEIGRETPLIFYHRYRSDRNDPAFRQASPTIFVRDWHCELINLEAFVGQTLTIEFIATNCRLVREFGYAYIDFCGLTEPEINFEVNGVYCSSEEEIISDPTSSKKLTNWVWTVQKTNSTGIERIGDEFISPWFHSYFTLPYYNLSDFMKSNGHPFECNSYYNIKLAGNNDCDPWEELTKTIFINCPGYLAAGPDKCCPNRVCSFQIGSSSVGNYSYSWSPTDGLSNPTISNPYYIPDENNSPGMGAKRYIVVVTDNYGCSWSDTVFIYHTAPTNVTLIRSTYDLCNAKYEVTGNDIGEIEWKDNNGNIIAKNINSILITPDQLNNKTTTVIVKNSCGSITLNDILPPQDIFWGDFNNLMLVADNTFWPKHPTIESFRVLKIFDVSLNANEKPAYMANEYKLEIVDRYGGIHLIKTEKSGIDGFENGIIQWDGKIAGEFVQMGVYRVRLTLYNCRGKEQTFRWKEKSICRDYIIHPIFKKCWRWTEENPILFERTITVAY